MMEPPGEPGPVVPGRFSRGTFAPKRSGRPENSLAGVWPMTLAPLADLY
jgi:hypothetical protein